MFGRINTTMTFSKSLTQTTTTPTAETLSGSVERVTFHSEESGFCVLRVKVRGHQDSVTVTGSAASISPGEYIECQGNWFNDKNYGLQFKSHRLTVVPPSTIEGIERYLGSGMIKGALVALRKEKCSQSIWRASV